jgi:heat-inducible transcriptional repressor
MSIPLTDRQSQVLRATVQRYIATAEPVGSEVLVKEYNLSVSSATIRNAMGFLEKAGLLYQPHVSAGRIPSDSGYRIYVDRLLQLDYPTPTALPRQLDQILADRLSDTWSLEAILQGAAKILATLSGYITLITLPLTRTTRLRHVQLVPVERDRVMLIVVTDNYETQSMMFHLPPLKETPLEADWLERELQILSNFLNEQLQGQSLSQIDLLDWQDLDIAFDRYGSLLQDVLIDLQRRLSQRGGLSQWVMSGVAEVLRQPEFMEMGQLQMILQVLEGEPQQVVPLLFEPGGTDRRVNLWIGSENPLEPMRGCSMVSSTYSWGKDSIGSIGVVGPTRMAYDNTIALVEATAEYLSSMLAQGSAFSG